MKKILLGLATVTVVSAISFSACGSVDPCPTTPRCSADPVPTADQVKACQDAVTKYAACKTQQDAVTSCSNGVACTSDNKTDSTKLASTCATQITAYTTCVTNLLTTDAGSTGKDGG